MYIKWISKKELDYDSAVYCIGNIVLKSENHKIMFMRIRLFVLENRFLDDDIKNKFYCILGKVFTRRNAFLVFIRKWITKKCVYKNCYDLLFNPISQCTRCVSIRRGFLIWRFSVNDIRRLFYSRLTSSSFQIPRVQSIINPYTNESFTKVELYMLYLVISDVKSVHWLIREFVRLDFNKSIFMSVHRSYLYKNALYQDIYDMDDADFRDSSENLMRRFVGGRFIEYGFFFHGLDSIRISTLRSIFTPLLIHDVGTDYSDSNLFILNKLYTFIETYPWIYKNVMNNKDERIYKQEYLSDDVIRECILN